MNNARQGLRSERGQGIVEYILLLVVVLTLAFLLANRFFQPFQKWVNYYLGSYVECLLDQGELPGQGGENGIQDCEFQNPFEAGGSGTSGSGSGGRDGETNTDKSKDGDGSDSSNNDSGRGGTLASRSGGAQRRIRVGGFDSPGGGKTTVAESETQAARSSGYFQRI